MINIHMAMIDIYTQWVTQIEFNSPLDFFKYDSEFWKSLLYEKHLLIFKGMNFLKEDYYKFGTYFGKPSNILSEDSSSMPGVHDFSNKTIASIGENAMPWHADLPNHAEKSFPIRALWMINNPNPDSGITSFMNLTDSIDLIDDKLKKLLDRLVVVQQQWSSPEIKNYTIGMNINEFGIIKTHPVTGKKSLRINSFNRPGVNDAWIHSIKIGGVTQPDCSLLNEFINDISARDEMTYHHKWETNDILVYDNWSLVHKRNKLNLPPNTERMICRMNILHV